MKVTGSMTLKQSRNTAAGNVVRVVLYSSLVDKEREGVK